MIDTIRFDDTLLRKMPELAERFGHGLLVILDPTQIASPPVEPGAKVRVHSPDGEVFDLVVSGTDISHAVVALFFRGTSHHEIPRLSEIEVLVTDCDDAP